MSTTQTAEHLPVLVYGTLRKGQGNYSRLIAPVAHVLTSGISLEGYRMHGGWGFPYITADPTHSVVVDLVEFPAEDFEYNLRAMDSLEGYRGDGPDAHNHYDRKIATVLHNGNNVRAYVYVASTGTAETYMSGKPVVEHGDWIRWIAERPEDDEPVGVTMTRRTSTNRWSAFGPVED